MITSCLDSEEIVICSFVVVVATSIQLAVGRIVLVFILLYLFSIIKQKIYNRNIKNILNYSLFLVYILGSLFCNCNLALIRPYFHVQSCFTPIQLPAKYFDKYVEVLILTLLLFDNIFG